MDGRNRAHGRSKRRMLAVVGIVAATVAATGAAPTSAADRRPPRPATTEVHLLAFNDFHGNLEPGTLNIYGQFAGGAAYLAKEVEEKQAPYGDQRATVIAGDNIGASPLVDGLFFEEPSTIIANLMHVDFASVGNHEFDKGAQPNCCGCSAAAASPTAAAPARRTPRPTAGRPSATRAPTSSTCPPTSSWTPPAAPCSRRTASRSSGATAGATSGSASSARCSRRRRPSSRRPASPGSPSPTRPRPPTRPSPKLRRKGVDTSILVIHQGGAQTGAPALNGCAGNLAGHATSPRIAEGLDPSIKVIVSGHTHSEYRCTITSPTARRA